MTNVILKVRMNDLLLSYKLMTNVMLEAKMNDFWCHIIYCSVQFFKAKVNGYCCHIVYDQDEWSLMSYNLWQMWCWRSEWMIYCCHIMYDQCESHKGLLCPTSLLRSKSSLRLKGMRWNVLSSTTFSQFLPLFLLNPQQVSRVIGPVCLLKIHDWIFDAWATVENSCWNFR